MAIKFKRKFVIPILAVVAIVIALSSLLLWYLVFKPAPTNTQPVVSQPISKPVSVVASAPVTVKPNPPAPPPAKPKPSPAPSSGGKVTTLSCGDCWLAPVDKTNALSSKYAPKVVPSGVLGGGSLTAPTAAAMQKMFKDAKDQGIRISVLSSYRSYSNQQGTFEYWVKQEMAKGHSRAKAEQLANVYSAKAGHSEHQLGTTADVKCDGCASFDNSSGNVKVYNFLKANAHKYGFVISYPEGKQNITGYKYEPWHIRYIGIEHATALFNQNYLSSSNKVYLAAYLKSL